LKRIGSKNPAYEWAKLLLVKLSQQPFGREHVGRVLDVAVSAVDDKGKLASVTAALQHLVKLAVSAPHVFGASPRISPAS
jgi:sister-chromatid-cohesion protein PDS5